MESPNLPATWLPILKHHLRDTVFSFQFYFPKVTDLRGRELRLLCKWGRCSREKAVFSGIFGWLMTGMGVLRCGVLPIVKTRLLQSSCYIHTNAISVSTVVGGASKRSQPPKLIDYHSREMVKWPHTSLPKQFVCSPTK